MWEYQFFQAKKATTKISAPCHCPLKIIFQDSLFGGISIELLSKAS